MYADPHRGDRPEDRDTARGVWQRLRRPLRGAARRQAGVALLLVTVVTAIISAVAAEFAFSARVDLEAASNSRDQLRAEYMARAGLQMGTLLVAVQGSIQKQLAAIPQLQSMKDLLNITDYAGFLAKAFGGSDDERAGLGGLVGIDLTGVQGLGTPNGTSFDLTISSEEGKFPLNCGGGLTPDLKKQAAMYRLLVAMARPQRYDRMFNVPDRDGVMITREDLPRNIIDWVDLDSLRFDPLANGSGSEETYDRGKPADRYLPHNTYMDTVEEVTLVRGVNEDFWAAFGEMFTVYGAPDCKVLAPAMSAESWPLVAAMLAASSSDPSTAFDPNTALVAQQVAGMLKLLPMLGTNPQFKGLPACPTNSNCQAMGITPASAAPAAATPASVSTSTTTSQPASSGSDPIGPLSNLICSDAIAALPNQLQSAQGSPLMGSAPPVPQTPLRKIPLCPGGLSQYLRTQPPSGGTRRFFRIDATGLVQRTAKKSTQVRIRGVWDAKATINNPLCTNHPSCNTGTWVYWRID